MIQGEYRRPGQPKEDKPPWQKINFDFSKGLEGIKKNFTLLKKEFSDRWVGPEGKPIQEHMLEQNQVTWEFRGPESLEQWVVSSDREIGGHSQVNLKLGKNNTTGFLYGTLNSTPPRDGETRYSGYCTLRSKQPQVSLWNHTFNSFSVEGCVSSQNLSEFISNTTLNLQTSQCFTCQVLSLPNIWIFLVLFLFVAVR